MNTTCQKLLFFPVFSLLAFFPPNKKMNNKLNCDSFGGVSLCSEVKSVQYENPDLGGFRRKSTKKQVLSVIWREENIFR